MVTIVGVHIYNYNSQELEGEVFKSEGSMG